MGRTHLADTVDEIGRIQRGRPPALRPAMIGDTHVVRAWPNLPIDAYVPGLKHHVIAAVLRGDGVSNLTMEGQRLTAPSRTGSIVLMPRGQDGWWRCTGSPVCSNIYLSRTRLQACADEVGRGGSPELLTRLNVEDNKLFGILALISDEANGGDALSRIYMEQLIDLLCMQLLRSHSAFPLSDRPRRGGLGDWQVRRVTDYMREHLDEDLGIQELADLIQLSRFHFCTAFRDATGYTPHQRLVQLRMQRARELLHDPRLRITDVALAVGYQTPSSFSLAFRNAVGLSPTAFRQQLGDPAHIPVR